MTSFGGKIDFIYRRLGERGLLSAIFAVMLSIHVVFAMRMSLPSLYPYEFEAAGWLHTLLYSPFHFLIDNPVTRYRSMLILNGIIAALIPLMVYRLTAVTGLEKAWQRTLVAIVAGVGTAAFAYTKFIWGETLALFLPFLVLWLFIKASKTKNRFLRHILSILLAFVLGAAPSADSRLWTLTLVTILVVISAKYILRVKSVYLTTFLVPLVAFTVFGMYTGERINAAEMGLESVPFPAFALEFAGMRSILHAFTGQLYYFAVSTWGLGILGMCLCVPTIFTAVRNRKNNIESGKPYLAVLALFAFLYNVFMLIVSALHGARLLEAGQVSQDMYIFGRFIDSASPFMLVFVLCYVFTHGLDFRKLLYAIISLGAVFALFLNFTAAVMTAHDTLSPESIQGFSPARISTAVNEPVNMDGIFFIVSATFCFIALLVVLVSCAERYRKHVISFCVALAVTYSCIHSAFVFLPYEIKRGEQQNALTAAVSEFVYNSGDAPPVYVLNNEDNIAPLLRFLNRNAQITAAEDFDALPEDCFIVIRADKTYILDNIIILGYAGELVFAAKGERAEAYVISQEGN